MLNVKVVTLEAANAVIAERNALIIKLLKRQREFGRLLCEAHLFIGQMVEEHDIDPENSFMEIGFPDRKDVIVNMAQLRDQSEKLLDEVALELNSGKL